MNQYLPLIGLFFLIIGFLIFGQITGVNPWFFGNPPSQTTVTIGELNIKAEIADEEEERNRGLSGRETLEEDRGLLFVFKKEEKYKFWMKDVAFPIDVIWISGDKKVVDFYQNTEVQLDVDDSQLRIYTPQKEALYVLEVNTGLVEKYNVQIGDQANFRI